MNGDLIPDRDHIVRYVGASHIDDGVILHGAFRLRPGEDGLSINWLECFADWSKAEQLDAVRRLSRLNMRPHGRLAELNVGEVKAQLRSVLDTLRFVQTPLPADPPYAADPSHGDIFGLPPSDDPDALLVGALIAECVQTLHPASVALPADAC